MVRESFLEEVTSVRVPNPALPGASLPTGSCGLYLQHGALMFVE